MNKDYEKPELDIIFFESKIKMLNSSIVIEYPWGEDNNVFFEE